MCRLPKRVNVAEVVNGERVSSAVASAVVYNAKTEGDLDMAYE